MTAFKAITAPEPRAKRPPDASPRRFDLLDPVDVAFGDLEETAYALSFMKGLDYDDSLRARIMDNLARHLDRDLDVVRDAIRSAAAHYRGTGQ